MSKSRKIELEIRLEKLNAEHVRKKEIRNLEKTVERETAEFKATPHNTSSASAGKIVS